VRRTFLRSPFDFIPDSFIDEIYLLKFVRFFWTTLSVMLSLALVLGCLRTKFQSLALRVKSLVLSTPWPCVLINIITPCTSMPSGPSITLLFCGLFHSHSPGGNTKFGRNCSSLNVTMRYDTKCYFNVRSIADTSQLKLSHGTNN